MSRLVEAMAKAIHLALFEFEEGWEASTYLAVAGLRAMAVAPDERDALRAQVESLKAEKREQALQYLADQGQFMDNFERAERLESQVKELRDEMERIANVTERWTDSLASQVNQIARAALASKEPT